MKNLRSRILAAIDEKIENAGRFQREQYEDDYDGFTHSTYSGLAGEVEEELSNEGYGENAPASVIEDFVDQMF